MARRPRPPLRNGAGARGQARPSGLFAGRVAMSGADEYPLHGDNELEVEDDDDIRDDATGLFGVDLGDCSVPNDVGEGDGGGGADSTDTHGTSSAGKRTSAVWVDFEEIKENDIRIAAICKMCGKRYTARSAAGTGHLLRHQASCKKKHDHARRVQSRLALNPDGLHNWKYDPVVARTELCRLIARLDLPLGIGETQDWEDYIKRAHNPQFEKISRQTTTRDLGKLFAGQRAMLMNSVLPGASSISLTLDICSGNAKEDYISVVAHYVSVDLELQKRVVGFRLIEVSHSGENIAKRIASVVEEFGLIDKVFAVTLDNASSNAKAMETLAPMFFRYLGSYLAPTPSDPNKVKYLLVHQCCACHIINLIVKSGLKRLKPYTKDIRTAINFLNSSNQRIALFKNYCNAKGIRPRKFGLDMDVRWNSTYLMLKHLLPYKEIFTVFINSHCGSELLTRQHCHCAEKIMEFLELFYDSTVVLFGVYYPTSPLVLHHILEIATHLHAAERDQNFRTIAAPMKLKFLKYWEDIPLLYSFAFILDSRAKMKGFFNVLELLAESTGKFYSSYYADVKTELYKLFNKYETKFGAARSQRVAQPSAHSGKKKQAWERIFGGRGGAGVVGPGPACSPSSSSPCAVSELSAYLDSDCVTAYEDDFDILLWWRDHKLTYPILSILARDIMSVPVSPVSSESCFSLSGRILEERRRRLLPENVEMLTCIKDWELGARREQHEAEDPELEEAFKNLYLDEEGSCGTAGASVT
ncbi:zinc finger BED domain-containing protein RICESLEEPER 2-like [Miscanthus floridulus]|uniref:zinc finger BED domain-containing protein RICESLEEPER 2-like n=1 Tax=Miscanthus floridulus TaxID=154761 RepID=UPI0034592611